VTSDQSKAPTAKHKADTRTRGRSFGQDMTARVKASSARVIATALPAPLIEATVLCSEPPVATVIAPEDAHDNPTAWVQMDTRESDTLVIGFHLISHRCLREQPKGSVRPSAPPAIAEQGLRSTALFR
jgi:hypothetical protein